MYRRRILNRRSVRGFSRYLNENMGYDESDIVEKLRTVLGRFMEKNNITSNEQIKSIVNKSLNSLLKNNESKGGSLTKEQINELTELITSSAEECINNARTADKYHTWRWTFNSFIIPYSDDPFCFLRLDKAWENGELQSFDPDYEFDSWFDWWNSLSEEQQDSMVAISKKIAEKYFNGNTTVSWKTYCRW